MQTSLTLVLYFSSSHNWNALFLGANAVADAMAQKYHTDKSNILDDVSVYFIYKMETSFDSNFVYLQDTTFIIMTFLSCRTPFLQFLLFGPEGHHFYNYDF